jgi:hypothetical protein
MGDNRFIYISSIALGLSGGFREDIIVFMFPLWFFCLFYNDFDYKKIFKSFIVLIASAMFGSFQLFSYLEVTGNIHILLKLR